ncbi:MAG: GtrA family protein [Patescibacteria group bacterium]|nr:GtrA family protein [Patescibacteria group bacterium]
MIILRHKDYYLAAIVGFLIGWFVLMPIKNFGFSLTPLLIITSVVFFTFFGPFCMFILKQFSIFWPVFDQFGKFAAVGSLNSFVDLAVLNFLIFITDISVGFYFSLFKTFSFVLAKTSSYFWNKFWTFESKESVSWREYLKFSVFTVIGLIINVGIATLIVNYLKPPVHIDDKIWANIGAVGAIIISMFWNFLSYKNIVFKNA